jgi:hypothetical protein
MTMPERFGSAAKNVVLLLSVKINTDLNDTPLLLSKQTSENWLSENYEEFVVIGNLYFL